MKAAHSLVILVLKRKKGLVWGLNKKILADSTNVKLKFTIKKKGTVQDLLNRNSKQRKIVENDVENYDFELEERKIALKERELQILVQATRKALAEAEALELINLEKKKSLGLL